MSSTTQLSNANLPILHPIYPPIPVSNLSSLELEEEPTNWKSLIQREETHEKIRESKHKVLNGIYLSHLSLMKQVLHNKVIDCDSLHREEIKQHEDAIGNLFFDFSQSNFSQEVKNKIYWTIEKHINPCYNNSRSFNPCAYCINKETTHIHKADTEIEDLLNSEIEQLSNKTSLLETVKGDSQEMQDLKNLKNQRRTIQKTKREIYRLFTNMYRLSYHLMNRILVSPSSQRSLHNIIKERWDILSEKLQKVIPSSQEIFNLLQDIENQFNNQSLTIKLNATDTAIAEAERITTFYELDYKIIEIINNYILLLDKEIKIKEDLLIKPSTPSTGALILYVFSGIASVASAIGCIAYCYFMNRQQP